jgi:hypothetical protein
VLVVGGRVDVLVLVGACVVDVLVLGARVVLLVVVLGVKPPNTISFTLFLNHKLRVYFPQIG